MKKDTLSFWIFLCPVLIAFVLVMIVPFILGVFYSLTDWNGVKTTAFTGLSNYKKIFTEDPRFLYSIIITAIYSAANIIVMNCCALSVAVLVTQNLRLKNFYRAGFFMPNLIGGLILGYIWQFIFNRALPALIGSDFFLLGSRNTALLALIIAGTWQYAGYLMVIYVTALQNIPKSLFEAAMIDGANAWERFKKITIPMMAPAFTITTFLTLLYSFKQFDVNYSLTYGGPATMFMGETIHGTSLISMHIVREAEKVVNGSSQMAVAQAKAVIFFFALLSFSLIQVYYNKRKEVEI